MKKLINLTVNIDTSYDSDTVGHIISNAVTNCNTDNGFVNLIKVNVGYVNKESLEHILKDLHTSLESQGVDNFILIPINNSVKDITIDEIRCTYEFND